MTLGMVHEWVHAGSATFTLRLLCGISAVWLAAALAAIVLRRSSAALRHRVWSLSIAAVLLLPALVAVLPEWRVGAISLPPAPEAPAVQAPVAIVPATPALPERKADQAMRIDLPPVEMPPIVPESSSAPPAAHPISPPAAAVRPVNWGFWLWLAWLIPALCLILWQAAVFLAAHNLVRRSAPLDDGPGAEHLSRLVSRLGIARPRLLESAEIGSPICLGCWRPAILLPADWKDWLPAQLEAVLTHELAHVTRRDVLWQLLARLACAVYWLHPLAWVAVWRLRVERELACDDWVLRGGESSTRYARWLLEAATRLLGREPHAAERIGVAMAARSGFEKRIRAILDPHRRRLPVSRPMAVILALAAAAVLGLAGMLSPLAAEKADAGEVRSTTAETPAIASELVRFSGRVEDEAGRALADAVVEVSAWPAPPRSVRTARDGRFAIETRRGRSGKHRLHARTSDGTRQGMQLVEFAELGNVDDLRLVLRPARELAVTVKDDKGQPIAGAWVAAVAHTWPYATTSDAMGRALLRMPADAELESVLADKPDVGLDYALFRRKDDLRGDPYRLDPTHRDPIALTLKGATAVRVRVVDGEQRPLEGVRVYPWLFTKPMKGGDLNVSALHALQRITDKQGIVEFRNVPADNTRPVIFWPRLDGYCVPKRCIWDPKSGQAEVTVQMLRQLQVHGRVLDTDHRPVGGAIVRVGGRAQDDSWSEFRASAVSAEDGSFHVAIDPNMRYLFVASHNRLASMAHVQMIGAEAPADAIKLVVQPATQVHGSIVVGPDRAPSPGASILLVQRDDWAAQEVTLPGGPTVRGGRPSVFHHIKADEQGRFEAWIAPGEYQISCDAGMGVSRQIELGDDGTCAIARYDDSTRTEEIVQVLAEGLFLTLHAETRPTLPPLKGRVVLTDKPAVGVADVALVGIVKGGGSVRMEGASDQQGNFTLARDPSDVYLHAATADGKLRGMVWVPADAGETVVPIGPTASVSGRVLDEKGEALAGRTIRFGLKMDDRSAQYPRAFGEGVTTGADGTFTIDGLVPGFDYWVTISVLADRRAPTPIVAEVTPRRAELIKLGDVKLPPPPPPDAAAPAAAPEPAAVIPPNLARISGRVEDEEGRPAGDVEVTIDGPRLRRYAARTDGDGRFALDMEPLRSLAVHGRTPDRSRHAYRRYENVTDEHLLADVRLVLRPAREFAVTVHDAVGQPVSDASVAMICDHKVVDDVTTDAAGRALLRMPTDAAPMHIIASKADVGMGYVLFWRKDEIRKDPYRLEPDHRDPVTLVLNGTTTIRVRVVDREERPMAGVSVVPWHVEKPRRGSMANVEGVPHARLTTDATGIAEFRTIPADSIGGIEFFALYDGYSSAKRHVWQPTSGPGELTIQMVREVLVTGRVVDPSRRPVSGAKVRAVIVPQAEERFEHLWRSTESSGDGSFQFTLLSGLRYQLIASKDNTVSEAHAQSVDAESPAVPVELRLVPRANGELVTLNDVENILMRPQIAAKHLAAAFSSSTAIDHRLAEAELSARRTGRHILLILGSSRSHAAVSLFQYRHDGQQDLGHALDAYVLVAVNTSGSDTGAAAWAERMKVRWPADEMTLAVLDVNGRLLAQTTDEPLTVNGTLDRQRLLDFLALHAPDRPDAIPLMEAAKVRAKREEKNILMDVGGPNCAPCKLLRAYFEANRALIEKDFVHVRIDSDYRNHHRVMSPLRGSGTSIPWMAILSPDGRMIINSDGPNGNIGYFSGEEGQAHWEKMLRAGAKRLTEAEIRLLVKNTRN